MNLNFNNGLKRLNINGDGTKFIEFNPLDVTVYAKFLELQMIINGFDQKMQDLLTTDKEYEATQFLIEKDKEVKAKLEEIFGAGAGEIIFNNANVFTPTVDGTFILENFLNALRPIIEEDAKKLEENSKKKTSKYTGKYEIKENKANV